MMASVTNNGASGSFDLEVCELTKTYPGGIEALKGISFSVSPGEILGLLGPNGAGKTTAVRILMTLLKPTRGSVRLGRLDVTGNRSDFRRCVGYVSQSSALDTLSTGRESLAFHGAIFGVPRNILRSRIEEVLDLLDLRAVADQRLYMYSGGMRRRLELARSLLQAPRIVIMDEPTLGLDPSSRRAFWTHLQEVANRGHMAVLFTTNQMEEADRFATRLVILTQGRIVASGTPHELKSSLQQDLVIMRFESDSDVQSAHSAILGSGRARRVIVEGDKVFVFVADGTASLLNLVRLAESQGSRVAEASVSRPTLEDYYLSVTGEPYHEGNPNRVLQPLRRVP